MCCNGRDGLGPKNGPGIFGLDRPPTHTLAIVMLYLDWLNPLSKLTMEQWTSPSKLWDNPQENNHHKNSIGPWGLPAHREKALCARLPVQTCVTVIQKVVLAGHVEVDFSPLKPTQKAS